MKLSIIIPVYRAEDTLERCIGSILQQSFSSYELILVDDGSPDACPQLCDEYAGKDSRIHVIHKENGGLRLHGLCAVVHIFPVEEWKPTAFEMLFLILPYSTFCLPYLKGH